MGEKRKKKRGGKGQKSGENGKNWGKMGKKWGKMGKIGEKGAKIRKKWAKNEEKWDKTRKKGKIGENFFWRAQMWDPNSPKSPRNSPHPIPEYSHRAALGLGEVNTPKFGDLGPL